MKIYRIENSQGYGPFTGEYMPALGMCSDHVAAQDDPGIKRSVNRKKEAVGCISLEQLQSWFTPDNFKKLEKYGYKIVEIEADVTVIGEKQVLFKRDWERAA